MNLRKMFKLKNAEQLESNVPYVFTIKDRNILDDKEDEIEVLENEFLNSYDNVKDSNETNYFKESKTENSNQAEEENSNDIYLELNEEEGLIQSNHDKIKDKLNALKNRSKNNKNDFTLNQKKTVKSDFMTREEFKKRAKKKNKAILDPNQLIRIGSAVEQNMFHVPDSIKTKRGEDDNDDKYQLEKIQLKRKINEDSVQQSNYLPMITNSNNNNDDINQEILFTTTIDNDNNNTVEEIMTDNSLFLSNIPSKQQIEEDTAKILKFTQQKELSLKDINKSGILSIINIPLPSETIMYQKESDAVIPIIPSINSQPQIITSSNISNNNKPIKSDGIEELIVGKGVCRALIVLKKRGILKEEELFGRNKDKSSTTNDYMLELDAKESMKKPRNSKEIEINYRDDKGRRLTPKEMARNQSHTFHGKRPGIKNTEKMILKQETMNKINNSGITNNTKTMQYMKQFQNKKDKACVPINGKKSAFL